MIASPQSVPFQEHTGHSAYSPDTVQELDLLRGMFSTIRRVALIATDPSGIITSFRGGAEILTGYKAEEVVGLKTPLLFHMPDEVEARAGTAFHMADYSVYTRNATGDAVEELECTYRRKDGVEIAVYLATQVLQPETAGPPGHLSTVRLVPGQKEGHYSRFIPSFGGPTFKDRKTGVLEVAYDWSVLYRDKRALEFLPDMDLGRTLWDLYPALVGTLVEDHLRFAMESRQPTDYENFYAPLNVWHRVHVRPNVTGIKISFEDITQARTLQDQLERERILREKRVEAISHMAGGLAHEISNPLAIINMLAADLETVAEGRDAIDAEEVKTTCAIILETSNRAMAILRGLKGFTREASKDPMVQASIPKIVDDCLQLQRSRFERERIVLHVELEPDLPLVVCREVQIGQIVNNILNNAFDAVLAQITASMAQDGWVCLRATGHENAVRIDVTDSGPGIPDDVKPHLMEPFYTTKEIGGGTGIGLSLSRAIAEDHGGTLILVDQNGPTNFRLTLPLQQPIAPVEQDADNSIGAP